jgi:broad specificity phosphatase PhoE
MIPILVIRHARTDWNRAGLIQGRTDRPLDAVGREEASAWRLAPEWDGAACLASPLRRALETAELLGLKPTADSRLIEMHWGEWEGRRIADLRAGLGETMARNEARGLDFRPPGGESPRDVQERLRPLIHSLFAPTILVTHKGVLRPLYALASGWDMQDDPPERLRDGCAHSFTLSPDGEIGVGALNIPLERARA